MSLTVETGAGVAAADTYISEADATTYAASRGLTAWATALSPAREIALRKGFDYLNQTYRYSGYRMTETQAGEFPRSDLYDSYDGYVVAGIPTRLKYAQVEAAFRALTINLRPDTEGDPTGFLTMTSDEIAGTIRETRQYAVGMGPQAPRFAQVVELIRPYLYSSGAATERA